MKKILLCLLSCFLFLLHEVSSQDIQFTDQTRFLYKTWDNKNGLPQNTVFDIVKGKTGYLWVATEEGLSRFDGTDFKTLNKENTPGLYSSAFFDLAQSSKNGIWAAAENTVLLVNNNTVKSYDFRRQTKGSWITSISEDNRGVLWIGTKKGDLYSLDRGIIKKHQNFKYGGKKTIHVLQKVKDGLLIGTNHGLFKLNKAVTEIKGFEGKDIRSIAVAPDESAWIGTKGDGLFHLTEFNTIQYTLKNGLKELYINSVSIAPNGAVWIGTSSTGLQVYQDGKFSSLEDQGFAIDGIKNILFTDQNLAWLGTAASGLIQMKPAEIQMLSSKEGLSGDVILPIYEHENGDIWVGTAGQGINRISKGKIRHYDRDDGLANEVVLSIGGTKEFVFIGTTHGLNRFNISTGVIDKQYMVKDGLADNVVQSVYRASDQKIWISTFSGGIHLLGDKGITRIILPAKLSNTELTSIFEDRDQNIWIGSSGNGIIRINKKGGVRHIPINKGDASETVYDFYQDPEGVLWLATEAGLISYKGNSFRLFNKSNGLIFNGIYRIIDDRKGHIWLSGNFGLQRIALTELRKLKINQQGIPKISARTFDTSDGMNNAEANGNISPAGLRISDGSIWFPTVQGIAIVRPALIHDYEIPLNVQIHSLTYDHHKIIPETGLTIPAGITSLTFDYTAINFKGPHTINYSYRLIGLSDRWENVGNRRIAYFTSLEAGDYTLQVRAEQYGKRSKVTSLSFTIAPFYYQTYWFKTGALFVLFIAGFFVNQLYSKSRQGARLQVLVENRTKELKESQNAYQSLFYHNPYAVFSFDLAGNFLSANRITAELTGYTVGELLNMSFVPLIPEKSIDKVLTYFIKAGTGLTQNYQTEIITSGGACLYVDVTNLPIIVEGKITGIYGIVKDITEEKMLSDELLKANERFRLANKATSDSIWELDLRTNHVERTDTFIETQFGYEKQAAGDLLDFYDKHAYGEDWEKLISRRNALLNDPAETYWSDEFRLIKPDGSCGYISARGYIVRDEKGKALKIIGASQDVTESRNMVQAIKLQNSKLRNIAWTQSHVVRAPLARILGIINVMDENNLSEELITQLLNNIKSSAFELDTVIRDIVNQTELVDNDLHTDDINKHFVDS